MPTAVSLKPIVYSTPSIPVYVSPPPFFPGSWAAQDINGTIHRVWRSNAPKLHGVPMPEFARKLTPHVWTLMGGEIVPPRRVYGDPIQALISDLGGSLTNAGGGAVREACKELFRRHTKILITDEEAMGPTGKRKDEHIWEILFSEPVRLRWRAAYGCDPTKSDFDWLFPHFNPIQVDVLKIPENNLPITGVKEVLQNVKLLGFSTASTTGYLKDMDFECQKVLHVLGVPLDHHFSADNVLQARPSGNLIEMVLAVLNLSPTSVIYFGDTPVDGKEGKAMHVWTVLCSLTSYLVGKSEEELSRMSLEEVKKANDIARAVLAETHPHYIVNGIWDLMPVVRHIMYLSSKGILPCHKPIPSQGSNLLDYYKPLNLSLPV